MTTMTTEEIAAIVADPVAQKLLHAAIPARLAYTGLDGAPRVIPIGWAWDGSALLMWTVPRSAKVRALRHDPRVAVTIDTNDFPPKVLLVRGTATAEEIEGVPQGYLDAGHKMVDDDAATTSGSRACAASTTRWWRSGSRPTWLKIHDFETRIPSAVAELVREKQAAAG